MAKKVNVSTLVKSRITPELKAFLVKNRAYNRFVKNCVEQKVDYNTIDGIASSINFYAANEDSSYWWELSHKLDKQINWVSR